MPQGNVEIVQRMAEIWNQSGWAGVVDKDMFGDPGRTALIVGAAGAAHHVGLFTTR